ncbi:MAG: molecular chaperone HtpG [Planctomycetaceae bacterium]|jgi:molecular chaperone HtpG
MPEMQFDFDGLIKLLAGHLYSEKKVFIRELVQNAHDAIQRRAHAEDGFSAGTSGRIDIISSLAEEPYHVIFRDNGTGMSKADLEDYLSSIGTSGTRAARENDHVPDVIGQFGIGFLSGFVVASRIEVRTRHFKDDDPKQGWLWKNEGRKDYTLEPCEVKHPAPKSVSFWVTSPIED